MKRSIAILGEYTPTSQSHLATTAAIEQPHVLMPSHGEYPQGVGAILHRTAIHDDGGVGPIPLLAKREAMSSGVANSRFVACQRASFQYLLSAPGICPWQYSVSSGADDTSMMRRSGS